MMSSVCSYIYIFSMAYAPAGAICLCLGAFGGKKKNFSASQSVFEFNKRMVMPFLMYAASFKVAFLRIIVIISLPHFLSFQLFAKVFTKADSPVTAM